MILLSGELGFDKDKQNFKIGDGVKRWDQLKYIIGNAIITDYTDLGSGVTPTAITSSMTLNEALANLQGQVNSVVDTGVTDVQINNTSIVSDHIANLSVSGTYNSSTNKLATVNTVTNAIGNLDVSEFPIGELTNIENSDSGSYDSIKILSIFEDDGILKSNPSSNNHLYIDIDLGSPYIRGEYEDGHYKQHNPLATLGSITNALSGLSATNVQPITYANVSSGAGKIITLKGISQTNGKIKQGSNTADTITIGDGALKIQGYGTTSGGSIPVSVGTSVFAANTTADTTLSFSNAFVLGESNKKIDLRTNKAISATNNIATMEDIASLSGAMHFVGSIDKVSNSIPTSGKYYTASIGGTTYYLHVNGTTGTATSVIPSAGDTLIVSGTSNITPLETGDMVVYSGETAASVNVVQTNMTIGTQSGQVAANDGVLASDKIIVSTSSGIASSSYGITDIASHTIGVTSNNGTLTVTDTLTVGGTDQAQSFTITGNNGISASSSGNAITIGHTNSSYTAVTEYSPLKIKIDNTGHITGYNDLVNADLGHGIVRASVSNTAGATTIPVSFGSYSLKTGGLLSLCFTNDVPANSYLNVNEQGAKIIYHRGEYLADNVIKAGDRCLFMYNATAHNGDGGYYLLAIDRHSAESNAADITTTAITDGGNPATTLIGASSVQNVLGTLAKYAVNTQNASSLPLNGKEYFSTATNQTIKFHKVSKTGDYNDLNNKLIEGKNIEISNIANVNGYEFYDYIQNTGNTRIPFESTRDYYNNQKLTFEVEATLQQSTSSSGQRFFGTDSSGTQSALTGIRITTANVVALVYRGNLIITSNGLFVIANHRYYINGEFDGIDTGSGSGTAYLYVKDLTTNEVFSSHQPYTISNVKFSSLINILGVSSATEYTKTGTKVHYAKFWVNDNLIVYGIPAKEQSTQELGLYNLQKKEFYPEYNSVAGHLTVEGASERQENIISALVGNINYTATPNTVPSSLKEPMSEDVYLHKIAKTGKIADVYQSELSNGNCEDGDMLIINCGSSTINTLTS